MKNERFTVSGFPKLAVPFWGPHNKVYHIWSLNKLADWLPVLGQGIIFGGSFWGPPILRTSIYFTRGLERCIVARGVRGGTCRV